MLPNKLLVNANGRRIRARLLEEHRLRGLWLATQAEVFPEAAVYPVVLHAGGPRSGPAVEVEVARITRPNGRLALEQSPIEIAARWFRRTRSLALFPPPESAVLRETLERLLAGEARLNDLLDLRWSISFHRAGRRERFVTREAPGTLTQRRFLGGGAFSGNGEVRRHRLEWAGWWMNYDRDLLREQGNAVPPLCLFERPKIVICQNGRTLRAAYDEQGYVLKDTFLCGVLRDGAHPLLRRPQALVGLLCSRAAHFFYSHVFYGGHVNGGYLHFLRAFLVDLPLGAWTDAAAEAVAEAVRGIVAGSLDESDAEAEIEDEVSKALGLSAEAADAIAEWCAADSNWQRRDRVRAHRR